MKQDEFFEFLNRFAVQPTPAILNRHVYLWIGEVDDLLARSPVGLVTKLDLHTLCQALHKTPLGDIAAGRELSDAIDEWISNNFPTERQQNVLLVVGLGLLYRYHLPLRTYIRLANENIMIIFALSVLDLNFRPIQALPNYVHLSPYAILKYIALEIPEEAIVKKE